MTAKWSDIRASKGAPEPTRWSRLRYRIVVALHRWFG